jgi:hypothetical protein
MRSSGSFISGILIGVLAAFGIFFLWQLGFDWLPFGDTKSGHQDADTIVDLTLKRTSSRVVQGSKRNTKSSAWEQGISQFSDSAFVSNDTASISSENAETIVVRRDELLSATAVTLVSLSALSKTDTLLTLFQGGDPSMSPQIRIEFWKSPVNFRGYKFIRNTLVTFGLDPQDQVKVFFDSGVFYLQTGGAIFRLNQTDRFLPFSIVAEESLPKQIRS